MRKGEERWMHRQPSQLEGHFQGPETKIALLFLPGKKFIEKVVWRKLGGEKQEEQQMPLARTLVWIPHHQEES